MNLQHFRWRHRLAIRRAIAFILVILALLLSVNKKQVSVVVARGEIVAGTTITEDHLAIRHYPPRLAPAKTSSKLSDFSGKIAATTLSNDEPLTASKILSEQLVNALVTTNTKDFQSEPGNMVPIKLADPNLGALLQHGDTVDVITAPDDSPEAVVIAAGGKVILSEDTQQGSRGSSVLIALPATQAQQVAAASLKMPLSVVISGERAGQDAERIVENR